MFSYWISFYIEKKGNFHTHEQAKIHVFVKMMRAHILHFLNIIKPNFTTFGIVFPLDIIVNVSSLRKKVNFDTLTCENVHVFVKMIRAYFTFSKYN